MLRNRQWNLEHREGERKHQTEAGMEEYLTSWEIPDPTEMLRHAVDRLAHADFCIQMAHWGFRIDLPGRTDQPTPTKEISPRPPGKKTESSG